MRVYFLHIRVRFREGSDSKWKPYALTLSLDGSCRHYAIKCHEDGKYTVDDGPPKFECLIMVCIVVKWVTFYSQ